LLLAVIASAHCESAHQVEGAGNILGCINTASKFVGEVTTYLQNKKWFDGPAVGRIVTAGKKMYDDCKSAFSVQSMNENPEQLMAYSSSCRRAIASVKSSIDTMRSNLRWKKFRTFSSNFKSFGGKVRYAKSVC
jgi:hypothetical protein